MHVGDRVALVIENSCVYSKHIDARNMDKSLRDNLILRTQLSMGTVMDVYGREDFPLINVNDQLYNARSINVFYTLKVW